MRVYIFDQTLFYWQFPDAYTQTKAEAEKLVIKANDINDLLTCCLRPGSIFGPGDMVMPTLDSYGRTNVRDYILCYGLCYKTNKEK
jgi:sterol-4alpha-carboxylate 3-dehydrogenase (decarboxylating)